MSAKEEKELVKLSELWATQQATMKQMSRCMELSRKKNFELKQQKEKQS